ncbi:MAG: DNA translocase FtsK 4TM domain-containing protein, partial [Deltaproteobacteria bacterium]|nr:DNA translocase FtsK 4TM domain-containing protein [Deltaproteobacteria bacterium]
MSHKTKSRAKNNNSDQKGAFSQEILGLFLLAGAIFACASLLSYSPEDPSLNHYALKGSSNWMGPVGANLAAFFMETLGLASWWVPVILAVMAWSLFCSRNDRLPSFPLLIFGWTAMLLATSMAFALSSTTGEGPAVTPSAASGGIVGLSLTNFLINWIGEWGTILSGVVLFITGLLAATTFSLAGIWPTISSIKKRGLFQRTKVRKPSAKDANLEGPVLDIPKITESRKNSDKKGQDVKGQEQSKFQISPVTGDFSLPPLTLLNDPPEENEEIDKEVYLSNARLLEKKLLDFGVAGNVVEICPGPVITMYEFSPAPGIKIN